MVARASYRTVYGRQGAALPRANLRVTQRPIFASYFSVYVPISGTWRGVQVETLGLIVGNESGMHSLAVIFQDSPKQVKRVFGPHVLRSQKNIGADVDNENWASIELVTEKDKIMLVCDDSM